MTRDQFINAVDNKITRVCGLGYDDLPDTVMIDDYYYEGMEPEEYKQAVECCACDILENAGC
jgi:hypothetical protein